MRILRSAAAMACALYCAVAPTQAQDLKIGAVFPMSGPNAEIGEIFSRSAAIAVDQVNSEKMLSRPLKLVIEDSQATPQGGVIAMTKLVDVEKAPYVLGAYTAVSKAIAPIGERAKVVTINGGAVGPDLAELGAYFWNVIPLVNFEVEVAVPYLVKERNLKRLALIYVDDPLGEAVQKVLRAQVPKAGGTIVGEYQVPRAAQQFASIAAKMRLDKPDVIYIATFGTQQAQIVKQLRDNGITQQLISYSGFSVPTMAALPEAKGTLYTMQLVDWKTGSFGPKVAAEYKKRSGKDPNAYVANYYNAVMVFAALAQALEKAGKPITGENLLAQRKASGTFSFVGGQMVFQPNGTVAMPVQITEIDGTAQGKRVK